MNPFLISFLVRCPLFHISYSRYVFPCSNLKVLKSIEDSIRCKPIASCTLLRQQYLNMVTIPLLIAVCHTIHMALFVDFLFIEGGNRDSALLQETLP